MSAVMVMRAGGEREEKVSAMAGWLVAGGLILGPGSHWLPNAPYRLARLLGCVGCVRRREKGKRCSKKGRERLEIRQQPRCIS